MSTLLFYSSNDTALQRDFYDGVAIP